MSFRAMAWASKQKTGSGTRKLILLMLADRVGDNNKCYPSQKRLAEDCELSLDTIKRSIKQLEKDGFLKVIHRTKEGVKLPNVYLLGVVAQKAKGSSTESYKPINEPISDIGHPSEEQIIAKGKELSIDKNICIQFYLYYESRKWKGVLDFVPLLRKWNMNQIPSKKEEQKQVGGVTW